MPPDMRIFNALYTIYQSTQRVNDPSQKQEQQSVFAKRQVHRSETANAHPSHDDVNDRFNDLLTVSCQNMITDACERKHPDRKQQSIPQAALDRKQTIRRIGSRNH